MDAGIMLNMLKGNAAATTPAASADKSVISKSTNDQSNDFPSMVDTVSKANSNQTEASPAAGKEEYKTLSMKVKGKGVMQPEGAKETLVQDVVQLEPVVIEKIVSQNKALASKLDSLIQSGDVEGYAAIMQNIKAIVEQINAGEFDISNLEGMLLQVNGSAVTVVPSAENSLSSTQAAAHFQPIMQVGTTSNAPGQLPVDILVELANLGQSSLQSSVAAGAVISSTGDKPLNTVTAPIVSAQPAQATAIVTAHIVTTQSEQTASNIASQVQQATDGTLGKSAHNPVVNGLLNKETVSLAAAAAASSKMAGASASPASPVVPQTNQVPVEGAILPQQAAVQATLKSHAQPAVQAQANHAAPAGQPSVETSSQANNNGQGTQNSNSEGQSQSSTSGQGQNSNSNGQSQQQMQDRPTHQQLEVKAEIKAANTTAGQNPAISAQITPKSAPLPAPEIAPKAMAPDLTNNLSANPGGILSTQASIAPKVFGGTLNPNLARNVAQQVGLEVTRAVKAGNTEFTVKLNPVDLGKVTIKMAFDKDGAASLRVMAQNPETVSLLQREVRGLERAIEAGGMKSTQADVTIELDPQHDGQSAGKAFAEAARDEMAQENRNKTAALKANEMAPEVENEDVTPLEQILAQLDSASGLDIRV